MAYFIAHRASSEKMKEISIFMKKRLIQKRTPLGKMAFLRWQLATLLAELELAAAAIHLNCISYTMPSQVTWAEDIDAFGKFASLDLSQNY
jgi:hypothetical protein